MNLLLDTNVLSEVQRPAPDLRVLGWLDAVDEDRVFISVASIAELQRDLFNSKGPFSDDVAAGGMKLNYLLVHQDLWGEIKTPSLRNVAKTAPYMNQGQFKSLNDVVTFYSTLQGMVRAGHHERAILAPVNLTPEESDALVGFLQSLTDEQIDDRLLKPLP